MCMSTSGPKAPPPPPPAPAAPMVLEQAAPDKAVKKKTKTDQKGNKAFRNDYTPSAAAGLGGLPTAGKSLGINKK